MSLITDDPDKSPRDCSRKRHHQHGRKRWGLIAAASSTLLVSLAIIILWLTLLRRPSSPPHFSLLAATIRVTASNNGSSVIVVDAAFTARNPNAHAAALYDKLQVSASYAGVPLGGSAALEQQQPAEEGEVVIMSAMLKSPWSTRMEEEAGALLRTCIDGQIRWKVANLWVSSRHGLAVDCVAVVPSVGSLQSQCATHVLS